MAERTVIESLSGLTIAISASLPATYDAAGYGATTITYTQIKETESISAYGMTKAVAEFTPIDTAVVAKLPGAKNYGTLSVVFASLPSDPGQDIVETASESTAHYSLKITNPDASIHYLDVICTKFENNGGAVGDVNKRNSEFGVCRKPVVVAQT